MSNINNANDVKNSGLTDSLRKGILEIIKSGVQITDIDKLAGKYGPPFGISGVGPKKIESIKKDWVCGDLVQLSTSDENAGRKEISIPSTSGSSGSDPASPSRTASLRTPSSSLILQVEQTPEDTLECAAKTLGLQGATDCLCNAYTMEEVFNQVCTNLGEEKVLELTLRKFELKRVIEYAVEIYEIRRVLEVAADVAAPSVRYDPDPTNARLLDSIHEASTQIANDGPKEAPIEFLDGSDAGSDVGSDAGSDVGSDSDNE